MKAKALFFILLFITTLGANQNPYILKHDGLIDQRAQTKIFEIGSEVQSKLNVNIYVDVKENNGLDMDLSREERIKLMKDIEKNIVKDLKKPYVVIALAIDQIYANILISDSLKDVVDRDEILDGYVIPLLASKDKNTLFAKTSAAVLNGYAQVADSIANDKDIKLNSSMGSGNKTFSTIWKMFMYTLVLGGIIIYAIIVMREKKFRKKEQKNEHT